MCKKNNTNHGFEWFRDKIFKERMLKKNVHTPF